MTGFGGNHKKKIDHFAISRHFRSKTSADLGVLFDHRLMVAKILLRTAVVESAVLLLELVERCQHSQQFSF